jgi:hypothetical protein
VALAVRRFLTRLPQQAVVVGDGAITRSLQPEVLEVAERDTGLPLALLVRQGKVIQVALE